MFSKLFKKATGTKLSSAIGPIAGIAGTIVGGPVGGMIGGALGSALGGGGQSGGGSVAIPGGGTTIQSAASGGGFDIGRLISDIFNQQNNARVTEALLQRQNQPAPVAASGIDGKTLAIGAGVILTLALVLGRK